MWCLRARSQTAGSSPRYSLCTALWCVLSAQRGVEEASALKLVQLPGEAPRASCCGSPRLPGPHPRLSSARGAGRSLVVPTGGRSSAGREEETAKLGLGSTAAAARGNPEQLLD